MTGWAETFLADRDQAPWLKKDGLPTAIAPLRVHLQHAEHGLEVAVAQSARRPTAGEIRKAWSARHGGRPSPVLLVLGYPGPDGDRVALCGPSGENPPVYFDIEPTRAARLAGVALDEPNRHAARRCLVRMLPGIDQAFPGVVNAGLLATQELRKGVPQRADWGAASVRATPLLPLRGRLLVEGLGYNVEHLAINASLLKVGNERRAVAIFCDEEETFDGAEARFGGTSAVSRGLALCDQEHLSWLIATRGPEIRLYAAGPDTGVGRKGRSETYLELNLALLPDDLAGYLDLLFSANALADGGTFDGILERSSDYTADLASRLRERVYGEVVPCLAGALATRLAPDPGPVELADAYEQTLVILFRLLFVAYGEDNDLLPYRTNGRYADHSLKRVARRLAEEANAGDVVFDEGASALWSDVSQLWQAVDKGNTGWGVPPYDGGLFADDAATSPAGAALAQLELTDEEVGPALLSLLVDSSDDGIVGPVDFRSLSVREFGTIYEGLLESELALAPFDLALDNAGTYVPARARDKVEYAEGEVYLHDRSGSRKSTGSYFTKSFAVEHLLDHALEAALSDHLARVSALLENGDEAGAAAAFFDFRCVDLAMGSGHFLVAAIDRIEARLSAFITLHPVPPVVAELERLRQAAAHALGELADGVELEVATLLRRQVARRCIYGVDRNLIAVELARLAVWIHTFIPGLPLSFLDHNLVVGDSLVGVGTVEEALDTLAQDDPAAPSFARGAVTAFLERAERPLRRLGTLADATVADVTASRAAHSEALADVAPARALFDLIVAHRDEGVPLPENLGDEQLMREAERTGARALAEDLGALHFPVAFPEVFLRERPGFDCVLGNPPWEEATVEELGFWARRFPGLKSMPGAQRQREMARLRRTRSDLVEEYEGELDDAERVRRLLVAGPFPGMGTGDPDLYKAFCWRFWALCREDGAIGVVLPRSALSAKGSTPWREAVLDGGEFADVTMLLNTAGWAFDDAEHRYTMGLVTIRKGVDHAGEVALRGPFPSLSRFRQGSGIPPARFAVQEFRTWSEGASFPLLPSPEAVVVFQKLRRHPRLDDSGRLWRTRAVREFDATNDKKFFVADESKAPSDAWPVYKGASFNLWVSDTGTYYAWADPAEVTKELERRREHGSHNRRSAFSEMSKEWLDDADTLPCRHPRVVFRDVARATDTRTVIAALVPGDLVITNQAPYLLWAAGDERDQAFLLGVLCSMPLDWYARRVVETHVNFHIFNGFPIPDPGRDDLVRRTVEEIAGRLAATDERFASWAAAVGVSVGSVGDDDYEELSVTLDAAVARLYGLDAGDLRVIYETFHERADYSAHRTAVVAALEALQ